MFGFKITTVFLLASSFIDLVEGYEAYADYEDLDYQASDDPGYYEGYDDEDTDAPSGIDEESTMSRIRRYQDTPTKKSLSPDEISEVRGAIKQLLAGIAGITENPFTPHTTETAFIESPDPVQITSTANYDKGSIANTILTRTDEIMLTTKQTMISATETAFIESPEPTQSTSTANYDKGSIANTILTRTDERMPTTKQTMISTTETASIESSDHTQSTSTANYDTDSIANTNLTRTDEIMLTTNQTMINIRNVTNATTPVPTRSTKSRQLDIPRLLEIIADLASEFETNLTKKLHDHLMKMSIPTCSTPTTPTTESPSTSEYDSNYTGSIIAKCFVCGLEETRIPNHAHCADAFAGDFLPLVPVDPSAKGRISKFRKYCKYSNVHGFRYNRTQPRAIFGRWTGGCSVRWIDLSGIYTQRSCRNRIQPTMGKHFASKRMAKLEKSLWNIENGCIFSPMATLVPLSRGISLYARFHACVCTGSWCNRGVTSAQWTPNFILLIVIVGIT